MIKGGLCQTKNMALVNKSFSKNILSKYSVAASPRVLSPVPIIFANTYQVNNNILRCHASMSFYLPVLNKFAGTVLQNSYRNMNSSFYLNNKSLLQLEKTVKMNTDMTENMFSSFCLNNKSLLQFEKIVKTNTDVTENIFSYIVSNTVFADVKYENFKHPVDMGAAGAAFVKKIFARINILKQNNSNVGIMAESHFLTTDKHLYVYQNQNGAVAGHLNTSVNNICHQTTKEYLNNMDKMSFTDKKEELRHKEHKYMTPPDMEFIKSGSTPKKAEEKPDEIKSYGCASTKQHTGYGEIDFSRLAARVYNEIESRIKREKERRGM